ncbi:MAG TPA: O-antigen ligase family protein, partial [Gaiella sp.]|nr:O-antigen ligase family protein [Gaiella sp.]
MRVSRPGLPTVGRGALVTGLVAAALFWVAYDNGTYGLDGRNTVAIVVWWAVVVAVVFGLLPRAPVPASAIVVGCVIASLALWTLASLLWSPSAEATFDEFNRLTLYLGTFVLVVLGSRRGSLGRWADGMAAAIAAVAGVALTSRLFPGSFPEGDLPTFLPGAVTRLSFPLGYWNGLAIFLALGIPLFLRLALVARTSVVRALALAPMPVIASAVYLTSSRGGVATALAGSLVLLVLTERRWAAVAAVGVSLVGSAAAVAVLLDRDELVNGPLGTDLVEHQGRTAAVLIGLTCVATSLLHLLGAQLLEGRAPTAAPAGRIAVVAAVVVAVIGVVASNPAARVTSFKKLPNESGLESGDFVRAHLLSGGGSGRWQFWSAALDQWNANRLLGDGAGSYESWWAQHASFSYFVRDAHSAYFEALGELGFLGFALTVALVVAGVAVGVRRSWHSPDETGVTTAAFTAVFAAYALTLGFEWMWQLTAVSVVGFTALALITGPATAPHAEPRVAAPRSSHARIPARGFGLAIAALAVIWALMWAQA